MTMTNAIRLASVRIATDVQTVDFYECLTGATPNDLTDDFVELVTPTATLAVSGAGRAPFLTDGPTGGAACNVAIVEFWVTTPMLCSAGFRLRMATTSTWSSRRR